MSNTFSLNRFCKYFKHDLKQAYNNGGLSLLVIGIIPFIVYVFYHMMTGVFSHEWADYNTGAQISALFTSVFVLTMTIPVKLYGGLTDKRSGADWILIPASKLEKFVSMVLVLTVVVPLVYFVVFFGSDWILSVLDPSYGNCLLSRASELARRLQEEMAGSGLVLTNAVWLLIFASVAENLLTFNLGSIYFQRGKVGKTILVLFAISTVLSFLFGILATSIDMKGTWLETMIEHLPPESFQVWFNLFVNVNVIISFAILLGLTWWRLKTIKH